MKMSSQLPSHWITQNASLPAPGHNRALDVACGKGRHSFWLAQHGWQVTALDRDLSQTDCAADARIDWQQADLETGHWPLGAQQFDLIVVVNYLHRPLFDHLRDAVRSGGTLIYETFMVGNEQLGRPHSPDFLLQEDELLTAFSGWRIINQMQGDIYHESAPQPHAVKQAIAVRKP